MLAFVIVRYVEWRWLCLLFVFGLGLFKWWLRGALSDGSSFLFYWCLLFLKRWPDSNWFGGIRAVAPKMESQFGTQLFPQDVQCWVIWLFKGKPFFCSFFFVYDAFLLYFLCWVVVILQRRFNSLEFFQGLQVCCRLQHYNIVTTRLNKRSKIL